MFQALPLGALFKNAWRALLIFAKRLPAEVLTPDKPFRLQLRSVQWRRSVRPFWGASFRQINSWHIYSRSNPNTEMGKSSTMTGKRDSVNRDVQVGLKVAGAVRVAPIFDDSEVNAVSQVTS